MSKLASKLSKRIMAAALSVAMVMSNMTVYAGELDDPQVEQTLDESVAELEETSVTPDDAVEPDDESAATEVTDEVNDGADDETVQAPDTGEEEATVPDAEDGTEDKSLKIEEEVKDEEEIEAVIEAEEPDGDVNCMLTGENFHS